MEICIVALVLSDKVTKMDVFTKNNCYCYGRDVHEIGKRHGNKSIGQRREMLKKLLKTKEESPAQHGITSYYYISYGSELMRGDTGFSCRFLKWRSLGKYNFLSLLWYKKPNESDTNCVARSKGTYTWQTVEILIIVFTGIPTHASSLEKHEL